MGAKSGNIPPFPSLGWNYWVSNCWDSVGLLWNFPRYVPAVTYCLAENMQGWPQKQISQRTICFNFSRGNSLGCEFLHAFGPVTHLSDPPKKQTAFSSPTIKPHLHTYWSYNHLYTFKLLIRRFHVQNTDSVFHSHLSYFLIIPNHNAGKYRDRQKGLEAPKKCIYVCRHIYIFHFWMFPLIISWINAGLVHSELSLPS